MSLEATILIYDDDAAIGQALSAALSDAGYINVLVTHHFEAALEVLEGHAPVDLLLADMVVPSGLSGIALARMARLRQPRVQVIFVTGHNIPEGERHAWPVLLKPLSEAQLLKEVSRALKTSPPPVVGGDNKVQS